MFRERGITRRVWGKGAAITLVALLVLHGGDPLRAVEVLGVEYDLALEKRFGEQIIRTVTHESRVTDGIEVLDYKLFAGISFYAFGAPTGNGNTIIEMGSLAYSGVWPRVPNPPIDVDMSVMGEARLQFRVDNTAIQLWPMSFSGNYEVVNIANQAVELSAANDVGEKVTLPPDDYELRMRNGLPTAMFPHDGFDQGMHVLLQASPIPEPAAVVVWSAIGLLAAVGYRVRSAWMTRSFGGPCVPLRHR